MNDCGSEARKKFLADFQERVSDRASLLKDPEKFTAELFELAALARNEGLIDADDQRELSEWTQAAAAWAIDAAGNTV